MMGIRISKFWMAGNRPKQDHREVVLLEPDGRDAAPRAPKDAGDPPAPRPGQPPTASPDRPGPGDRHDGPTYAFD